MAASPQGRSGARGRAGMLKAGGLGTGRPEARRYRCWGSWGLVLCRLRGHRRAGRAHQCAEGSPQSMAASPQGRSGRESARGCSRPEASALAGRRPAATGVGGVGGWCCAGLEGIGAPAELTNALKDHRSPWRLRRRGGAGERARGDAQGRRPRHWQAGGPPLHGAAVGWDVGWGGTSGGEGRELNVEVSRRLSFGRARVTSAGRTGDRRRCRPGLGRSGRAYRRRT